MLNMILTYR